MPRQRLRQINEQQTVITPQQQHFIEAMLAGHSVKDAAHLAGCSPRAAFYWLEESSGLVCREYERLRALQVALFEARIARLHDLAITALEDLLSPNVHIAPFLRFQAVKLLYDTHLYRLMVPRQAQPAVALLTSGVEEEKEEQAHARRLAAVLYDDRNRRSFEDE